MWQCRLGGSTINHASGGGWCQLQETHASPCQLMADPLCEGLIATHLPSVTRLRERYIFSVQYVPHLTSSCPKQCYDLLLAFS